MNSTFLTSTILTFLASCGKRKPWGAIGGKMDDPFTFAFFWGHENGNKVAANTARKKKSSCPFDLDEWFVRSRLPIEY